jgi:hypothetical protein
MIDATDDRLVIDESLDSIVFAGFCGFRPNLFHVLIVSESSSQDAISKHGRKKFCIMQKKSKNVESLRHQMFGIFRECSELV